MPTETAFKYLNEVRFMALSNWSVGAILSDKVLYKDGFKLEPIGNLIIRNREKNTGRRQSVQASNHQVVRQRCDTAR